MRFDSSTFSLHLIILLRVSFVSFVSFILFGLQEAGNVPYVVDGGFGVYTGNNPKKIALEVYSLFEDEARLEAMSVLARQKSRAESSQLIARDIGEVAMRKVRSLPELKSSMS